MPEVTEQEAPPAVVEEAPPAEEPIVEEAAPSPVEGEAPPPAEEDKLNLIREVFKGATVTELRAALDEVPTEVRTELESEIERRGEQRWQTRERERTTSTSDRHEEYRRIIAEKGRAESELNMRLRRVMAGDPNAFNGMQATDIAAHIDTYANGTLAQAMLENEEMLGPLREKYLPELSNEERQALDKALYEDARRGTITQVPIVVDLAIERARKEGFEEGVKKGEQNRQAKAQLAEKVERILSIQKQAPGVQPSGGRSVTKEDERVAIAREMQSINTATPEGAAEWARREHEFRQRLAQLKE